MLEENPGIIHASLTAYGEQGPEAEIEGFDAVAWWSRTGLMDMVRAPGTMPGASVPGMGDHPTAVALYASIVTALLRRERTGQGSKVHTSLLANGLWSNSCWAQGAFVGVELPARDVVPPPTPFPNRVLYECSDGRLLQLSMIRTDEELDRFLVAAGLDDLLSDERFADPASRLENGLDLIGRIREVLATRPAPDWRAHFLEAGLSTSVVVHTQDVTSDPQLVPNGIVAAPTDPRVPAPLVINHPVNVEGLGRVGTRYAPEVGENTAEILAELGFDEASISDYAARGIT